MLQNYFKIALRTLLANRLYSGINVIGLSVSMACCLLITLYVWNELSYDRFHERANSIYRITTRFKTADSDDGLASSSHQLAPQLRQTIPELTETVRFKALPVATIRSGTKLVNEADIYQVDKSVFTVFSYRLLSGSKAALDKPNSVVLTQRLAQKYFGTTEPVGKLLRINNQAYLVTGVLQNPPINTDLKFSALLTWKEVSPTAEDLFDTSCYTFLLLQDQAKAGELSKKLAQFDQTQIAPRIKALGYDFRIEHQLQALTDLHFIDGLFDDTPKGSKTYLTIFAIVAAFILLVACINYVNMYVAQSIKRQKEVGVRKVVGAGRRQLVGQFLGEALLLISLSAGFSLVVMAAIRPMFEQLTAVPLGFPGWSFVAAGVGIVGLVGLLAGLYPAIFLAGSRSSLVLKGSAGLAGKQYVRKTLVVFQFTLSITLIVSTLVVSQQTDYLRSKDPGFTKEQVLVVNVPADESIRQKMQVLKTALAKDSRVNGVSLGINPITYDAKTSILKESNGQKADRLILSARIDDSFLTLLKIRLVAGQNFDATIPSDKKREVIVNERFIKWMGWTQANAVGRIIKSSGGDAPPRRVIGVVADYHFASLHNQIEPIMLIYQTDSPPNVLVRVKTADVGAVRSIWESLIPNYPFEANFLDTLVNQQYQREEKAKILLSWFSALIIFIACLGLFGLATFTTEQRTKEIGIRKVLGASVASIVGLLSKDFLKLVVVAIVLASPIAWWAMRTWLQGFAYKIDIAWWVFALAGLLATGIALLTVSFQSVKAALMNPVKSLRSE
ncbi:FtsX-like permease family protein [Spirosoma sp. KCTC 42546]|uniref:ABC transporter permease n=1 Tax=Spirosoma sp. KCTC 42546 TaxID=2520506 RepID=UPI00115A5C02|nr:ABC transporter permease [Spirosoma sp. KCTC 42546]QDK77928.1 FtsX-like permease family protein [Spirosoma sp. KCTC 42546]